MLRKTAESEDICTLKRVAVNGETASILQKAEKMTVFLGNKEFSQPGSGAIVKTPKNLLSDQKGLRSLLPPPSQQHLFVMVIWQSDGGEKKKNTNVHDDGAERRHFCPDSSVNKLDQHYKLKKV